MAASNLRVIFTGGGTGGHVFPAIALAQEMQRRNNINAEILFVGTNRGMEARLVPKEGYRFKSILISGLRRGFSPRDVVLNLLLPVKIPVGLTQAFLTVLLFRPDVVVGTGGYVSGPVILAAAMLGRKTVIQEQNSFPGWTSRFLSRLVHRVHLTFEDSARYFGNREKLRLSGNPTRGSIGSIARDKARDSFKLDPEQPVMLVTGGSQGAHSVNRALAAAVDRLIGETGLQIIWQTGIRDYDSLKKRFEQFDGRIKVLKFIDNMDAAYSAADFVLCRAGAMTIAEVTICGLPAIFVPYPYAAGDHQRFNAESLVDRGAAVMIPDDEVGTRLEPEIMKLHSDQNRLREMSQRSRELAMPDAAARIIDDIFELIHQDKK